MSEKLDDCQSACMEAENEFYEASDKIEVQRYVPTWVYYNEI